MGCFNSNVYLGEIKMIDYEVTFINTDHAAFPDTLAINVSAPGAGDGTEFVAAMVNDIWGRAYALLDYAGLTPDGVTEAPDTAQVLEAIGKGFAVGPGMGVTYWKNGTPAANGDRVLLLQGQVILIASYPLLDAACWVGAASNPTAPSFYRTSDAGGTTRNIAGGYLVLPDTRAVSLKGAGNQTINTRVKSGPAFGAVEEDQMQGHRHNYYSGSVTAASAVATGTMSLDTNLAARGAGFVLDPITDGVNGTPRTGATTRDNTLGTNYGITY
jgi:hypothetical protein